MNLNNKHFFPPVVLMAVVNSNYRFIYKDVGAYGKDCDYSVFQKTNSYRMLTAKAHNAGPTWRHCLLCLVCLMFY